MTVRKLMLIALLAAVSAQAYVRPTTKAVTVNPTNFNLLFPTAEQFGRSVTCCVRASHHVVFGAGI